jgi:hypothetical protein
MNYSEDLVDKVMCGIVLKCCQKIKIALGESLALSVGI